MPPAVAFEFGQCSFLILKSASSVLRAFSVFSLRDLTTVAAGFYRRFGAASRLIIVWSSRLVLLLRLRPLR
jgi:hypothetical protein